jgi:hypothetical protein
MISGVMEWVRGSTVVMVKVEKADRKTQDGTYVVDENGYWVTWERGYPFSCNVNI